MRGVQICTEGVCCSTPPAQSARFLIALRGLETSLSRLLCLGTGTSCFASGHPLGAVIFHASAVILSKFRMLTRGYRVGSSSCGLNSAPLITELRLPLLWRHFVDLPRSACDVVPPVPAVICAVVPSFCTTCETCCCAFRTRCLVV